MTENALVELAGRVEALSGPDREVDALIHFLTSMKWANRIPTWPPSRIAKPDMEPGLHMHIEGDGYFYGDEVPIYTASLDAAATLVPEGMLWTMDSFCSSGWSSGIWNQKFQWIVFSGKERQQYSPALALTAAALRAHAAQL